MLFPFCRKAVHIKLLVGIWKSIFSKTIWSRRSNDNSSFSVESKMALSRCNSSFQRPSKFNGLYHWCCVPYTFNSSSANAYDYTVYNVSRWGRRL